MGKKRNEMLALLLAGCMIAGAAAPAVPAAQARAAADLTAGLVGYWDFANGELTNRAADSAVTAEKTGTGVTLKADEGISNGSVYFSQADNSCLKLLMNSTFNVHENDFTLAAWVKYDADMSGKVNLFQQADGAANPNGRTILYFDQNKKYGTYLRGADCIWDRAAETGAWHHVAFTSNHATNKAQLYLNGTLVEEKTMTGSAGFYNGATDILVGAHKNLQASGAVKGSVDELRVYNRIVGADDVKAMYDEFAEVGELADALRDLQAKIAEAERLAANGGEGVEALQAKIAEAKEVQGNTSADLAAVSAMNTELQAAISAYKKQQKITIEVDTRQELRTIPDAMFGINHRYHNDGYSSWNASEKKIEEQFNELTKEANFGSVRYPGGTVANLYDWKRAIGPTEQRKKTIHGNNFSPISPNFGVDEAMTWIYDDLDAEAIWVYGMGQGSAADAADLFEYLNAPADGDATNPNGGVDWAEVRKANGHEKPYGVTRFEIGNEMGLWGQNYWLAGNSAGANYNGMANAYVNGGEMSFGRNTKTVKEEDWRDAAAAGDGSANQVRYVRYTPVKEGSAAVYVNNTQWTIVDSLEGQGASNVCTLDYATGKICFGDGVNGNKPASGQTITASYTTKQDGFTEYYKQLKAIAAELGMEVQVYSCMERTAAINALKAAGNQYDGAVIHPYSETNQNSGTTDGYILIDENDPEFYEKLLGRSQEHNMTRVQALINQMGAGKVPVVSEFGIYKHNTQFVRSIGHAVYIANEMIDYVGFGTPYLNKHCLVDYPYGQDDLGAGAQCVIQAIQENGSVSFVSTPSAKVFSIFNGMTGNTQVGQKIIGNDVYYTWQRNGGFDVMSIKAISTKDDEGNTYVTVVNNRKDDVTSIELKVDERNLDGQEIEVWSLTSEHVDDENTKTNPNLVDVRKAQVTNEGTLLTYKLAPHSVTSFKIPAEKPALAAVTVKAEEGGNASGSAEVEIGREATVTAEAAEGYAFAGWYKGEEKVSEDAAYTFVVTEDVELTAKFTKKQGGGEEGPILNKDGMIVGGMKADSVKGSVTGNQAALAWAAVNGADGYVVERKDGTSGTWKELKALTGTSYTDGSLSAGGVYVYRIRAYQMIDGKRVYFADAAEQTVKTAQEKLAAPKKLKAKKTAKGVKLTWKKVQGADGYLIYRSYKKKKGYKKIATIKKGTKKTYLYKKAKKGKIGYYKIKAYRNTANGKITSGFSKVVKRKR